MTDKNEAMEAAKALFLKLNELERQTFVEWCEKENVKAAKNSLMQDMKSDIAAGLDRAKQVKDALAGAGKEAIDSFSKGSDKLDEILRGFLDKDKK